LIHFYKRYTVLNKSINIFDVILQFYKQ